MHLPIRVRGRTRRGRRLRRRRRREEKGKKTSKIGRAMQTQINRKNIIIEKGETAEERGGRIEGRRRETFKTGHARGREREREREGGEVANTRASASVGACALSQGELLSFAGGSSKEKTGQRNGYARPTSGNRDVFHRSSYAPEVENLSDSLLSTRISLSLSLLRELSGAPRFIIPVCAISGKISRAFRDGSPRSLFREKAGRGVVREFRHNISLDSFLPRSSSRSLTFAKYHTDIFTGIGKDYSYSFISS